MTVARRGRVRVGPAAAVSLSGLDRRIIGLVSDQRVVTSTQLELLFADVPGRTLRYRTEHLHRAGLLGRSRPTVSVAPLRITCGPRVVRTRSRVERLHRVVASVSSRTRCSWRTRRV
jgi:hypothetical protein